MNSIPDSNAPFERINKYKLRLRIRPWITPALQKLISVKKSLLNNFIKSKDHQVEEHLHVKYKTYRNTLSNLSKKSKMNYYNHYFKANWDNIKIMWKVIKSILSINNNPSTIPKILVSHDITSTEPMESANIFKNFVYPLLLKLKKVLNIFINTFLIFLKIDLMTLFS